MFSHLYLRTIGRGIFFTFWRFTSPMHQNGGNKAPFLLSNYTFTRKHVIQLNNWLFGSQYNSVSHDGVRFLSQLCAWLTLLVPLLVLVIPRLLYRFPWMVTCSNPHDFSNPLFPWYRDRICSFWEQTANVWFILFSITSPPLWKRIVNQSFSVWLSMIINYLQFLNHHQPINSQPQENNYSG